MKNVHKTFGTVKAVDGVTFQLEQGEVHGLLGENGAGKTTLMNLLYGLYRPDHAEIHLNGRPVSIDSPQDAIRLGIGMVHQHFMLAHALNVIENIVLGTKLPREPLLLLEKAEESIRRIEKDFGLELPLRTRAGDLPVGMQQRLEIIKALYRGAEILILDEPTSVLTPQETAKLFEIIERMKKEGLSVIFITHKLEELNKMADRVTVMRDGKIIGTVKTAEADSSTLAEMMVGRPIHMPENRPDTDSHPKPEPVFRVENLHVPGSSENRSIHGISFSMYPGEILGMAGVDGNGQTELAEALMALRPATQGQRFLMDEEISPITTKELVKRGINIIPQDRLRDAVIRGFSVEENLILNQFDQEEFSNHGLLRWNRVKGFAEAMVKEYSIKTPDTKTVIEKLSGGNQQKVLLARVLSRPLKLLIAMQPTRGLDIGATEFVRNKLLQAKKAGVAVLLFSTELEEVLSLSDRVGVMFRGELMHVFRPGQMDLYQIGLLMSGVRPTEERGRLEVR
jgi:general nucleoside transport system ATP-binding protein